MVNDMLLQKIRVKATMKNKPTFNATETPTREAQRLIIRVMDNIGKKTRPIAAKLGQTAKFEQHAGLMKHRAIFTHKLYNSIVSKQVAWGANSAGFDVGTTISDKYPLYLIHGRPPIVPKRAKFLRIRITPNAHIFRTYAKEAKPKDYMRTADSLLRPQISGVVKRYINEAFG